MAELNSGLNRNNGSSTNSEAASSTIADPSMHIFMSPLLSKQFETMMSVISTVADKIQTLEEKVQETMKQLSSTQTFLEENRQLYLDLLQSINTVSSENKIILEKNTKLYTEAIHSLQLEDHKVKKITTVFDKICKNNSIIENNIVNPLFESRVYNRFWRMNHTKKQSKILEMIHQNSFVELKQKNLKNETSV